jgi:hypothetical protein
MTRLPLIIGLFAGLTLGLFRAAPEVTAEERPKRVILLVIDGLHWEAPEKLDLHHFLSLVREGASFKQAWLVPTARKQTDHVHAGPSSGYRPCRASLQQSHRRRALQE